LLLYIINKARIAKGMAGSYFDYSRLTKEMAGSYIIDKDR
jgi:hypothetical protein